LYFVATWPGHNNKPHAVVGSHLLISSSYRLVDRLAGEAQHMAREEALDVQFTAQLRKSPAKGGWYYIIWPEAAAFFGTRGLVKVRGTIDKHPFRSAFMAMGGGVHKLPVKAETRDVLGKEAGDVVTVRLTARDRG
jgi:hypothetical protein